MDEREPISAEPHALDAILDEWQKKADYLNRGLLSDEIKKFKADPAWEPHTRERFRQYADARGVRRLLEDRASAEGTVLRESDRQDHPYTVIKGWGPPPLLKKPETATKPMTSPPPKKEEPTPPPQFTKQPETIADRVAPPPPSQPPKKEQPAPQFAKKPEPPRTQPGTITRPETVMAETVVQEAPPPEAGPKKKRLLPILLAIWGIIVVAALVFFLFIYKPPADTGAAAPTSAPTATAEASAMPTTEQLTGPERFSRVVLDNSPVYFKADLEFWLPEEEQKLEAISRGMADLKKVDLTVTGHTADLGLPNPQFVLSAERAFAVRDYLMKRRGAVSLSILAIGRGANDPAATGKDLAPNRRVEIKVRSAE